MSDGEWSPEDGAGYIPTEEGGNEHMSQYIVEGTDGERHTMNSREIEEYDIDDGRVVIHDAHMCPLCTEGYTVAQTRGGNTYGVELTFKEWMGVASALSASENTYRAKDMDGMANKRKAIREEIAEQLENHD